MLPGAGWVLPSNSDIKDLKAAELVEATDTLVLRDRHSGAELSRANITFSDVLRSTTDYRFYPSVGEYASLPLCPAELLTWSFKVGAVGA